MQETAKRAATALTASFGAVVTHLWSRTAPLQRAGADLHWQMGPSCTMIHCHKDEYGKIEPLANACKAVFGVVHASYEDAEKALNELVENYQKSQRQHLD